MSIAAYLKEIGRGKDGARSLDAAQAEDLMRQVLDGKVSDLQLGAFAIAMRIKGESAGELAGFLAAAQAHLAPEVTRAMQAIARPVVWLPSYNGARRLPNLTPLLAGLLAQRGLAVVVHGRASDPVRVTSHSVFEAIGWPMVDRPDGFAATWQPGRPLFVTTDALCPPLARLLDLRWQLGLRNSGHTIAKLLAPVLPAMLRVVNHTHPEYGASLAQFLVDSRADALLLRGTEGEPVADSRRTPRMDLFAAGLRLDALGVPAQEGVLSRVPQLPSSIDAVSTASFIIGALAGASQVPPPLQAQVNALVALADATASPLEHAA